MKMQVLKYRVSFTTPAFLGNAEQQAQWRTPPFKALLRQWWRVVYAADQEFKLDIAAMRHEEGLLFGHAWLDDYGDEPGRRVAARKSPVRMRLDSWDAGKLKNWPASDAAISHPEVPKPVGSQLYLGYGPLVFKHGTALKANAAVQAGESATLSIAVPNVHAPCIKRTLALMDRYGSLGGRSRNGWGSFVLRPGGEGESPLRLWRDCLDRDWPHAIGRDGKGPLIWQTAPQTDWKALMRELAILKIGLRTPFPFTTGKNAPHPEDRHWLSYPVTNHSVMGWEIRRLPNSLRFKVRSADNGKLVGVIFHVPCMPPCKFQPDRRVIETVWQRVHTFLDAPEQKLARITE